MCLSHEGSGFGVADVKLHHELHPCQQAAVVFLQSAVILSAVPCVWYPPCPVCAAVLPCPALCPSGISFSFTPLKQSGASPGRTPFLTPSKVLLSNAESRMNMLSPGDATKLYHADVEYGKVVSEWRFNKDEVDIPQVRVCAHVSSTGGTGQGRRGLDGFEGLLWCCEACVWQVMT